MLDFEVLGEKKTLLRTRLEIVSRIVQNNGNVLRTHATEPGEKDAPYLINNLLSFFFRMRRKFP